MKKIIFLSAVSTLLLTVVSAFVYVNNDKDAMDDLFRANVEVLANYEGVSFGPMCSKTGSYGNYYMKLCSKCNGNFGYYAMDAVAFCLR